MLTRFPVTLIADQRIGDLAKRRLDRLLVNKKLLLLLGFGKPDIGTKSAGIEYLLGSASSQRIHSAEMAQAIRGSSTRARLGDVGE